MSRQRITPLMSSKGIFEVSPPFRLRTKRVYEVVAIRELDDLWSEGIDVYETFYKPYNISDSDYKQDVGLKAAIISLLGEEGVIHVPDTYILSYPESALANYQHVVLSVSLGAINKNLNLDALKNDISELVSKVLGVEPKVNFHAAPVKEALTVKEANNLEKVRQGNVQNTESNYLNYHKEKNKFNAVIQNVNKRLLSKFGT